MSAGRQISLPPTVWGPIFWNTFHIVALGYSPAPTAADKEGAKKFYDSYATVIPCPICREHYKQQLVELPVDDALHSREALIEWTWVIHNRVNEQLNKPTISLDAFLDHMESLETKQASKLSGVQILTMLGIGMAVGAAGVAGYYYIQKRK
jgi:hypothetical protein